MSPAKVTLPTGESFTLNKGDILSFHKKGRDSELYTASSIEGTEKGCTFTEHLPKAQVIHTFNKPNHWSREISVLPDGTIIEPLTQEEYDEIALRGKERE